MGLEDLLRQYQEDILGKWFSEVLDTYPEETAKFVRREKNPFANPVGSGIREGLLGIYEQFVQGMDHKAISPFLDRIVRVRAIQDFTPAGSVAFVYGLKRLIRSALEKEIRNGSVTPEDLFNLDARVDELALLSFDVYTACREKLYELRIEEVKRKSYRLLQRANLLGEFSGAEEELDTKEPVTTKSKTRY